MDKATEVAVRFTEKVLDRPLSELGKLFSDQIGYWRLKNQVNLMLKAKSFLDEKGITPGQLSPDIVVPLLGEGSQTEDTSLQSMFSALLANHLSDDSGNKIHPSYTKVLSQLSPFDAKLLVSTYNSRLVNRNLYPFSIPGKTVEQLADGSGASTEETYLSCLNLSRLGVFTHTGNLAQERYESASHSIQDSAANQKFELNEYGLKFFAACQFT